MVKAVATGKPLDPYVPTFEDGYRNAVICDAILKSAETDKKEPCIFE
jgi:predicted dehydrogenase